MPCTAKKYEKKREENLTRGLQDVDSVITTRELGRMIKMFGIDFANLKDEAFDQDLLGEYTGAGAIFGVSGGVMESRITYSRLRIEWKNDIEMIDFESVRGEEGA